MRHPLHLFIVKKYLEGLRRLKRTKDLRASISEKLLFKVGSALHDVCFSEYETFLYRAVFSFNGLLKVRELAYTSAQCTRVQLTIRDIKFYTSKRTPCISIHVRFSRPKRKRNPYFTTIYSSNQYMLPSI